MPVQLRKIVSWFEGSYAKEIFEWNAYVSLLLVTAPMKAKCFCSPLMCPLGLSAAREQNTAQPAASAVVCCSAAQRVCRWMALEKTWALSKLVICSFMWRSCWTCFRRLLLQACTQGLLGRLYSREVRTWDAGKAFGFRVRFSLMHVVIAEKLCFTFPQDNWNSY